MLKKRLQIFFVYCAALLLMFEEWAWRESKRLWSLLPQWQTWQDLERRVAAMRPYPALALFVGPAIVLFPVKVLALISIAYGHPVSGILIISLAKLISTALVARIYTLTRPTLLSLNWFARLHGWAMAFKDRMIARLRAAEGWQHFTAHMAQFRLTLARWRLARQRRRALRMQTRFARLVRKFAEFLRRR